MSAFVQRLLNRAREHSFWHPGQRIVVSVSGGSDSVALLRAMCELAQGQQLTIAALHMNFGLRGKQSDGDEEFCRQLCAELGVTLHVCYPETECAGNVQGWARAQRRAATRRILAGHDYDFVALGHSADDRAETVILHLFRGAGPEGMGDLLPLKEGQILRPLVRETKHQIVEYLSSERMLFRIDRTNLGDRYRRNQVRHHLIPLAGDIFESDAILALNQFADLSALESQYMQAQAEAVVNAAVYQDDCAQLSIELVKETPPAILLRALRTIAKRMGGLPGRAQSLQLLQLVSEGTGHTIELGNGIRAERGRACLWIFRSSRQENKIQQVTVSIPGHTTLPDGSCVEIEPAKSNAPFPDGQAMIRMALPSNRVSWLLRPVQAGDRMQPFGMNGNRMVSDLLSEAGIPRFRRSERWVMTDGEKILWLLGIRQSESGRIDQGAAEGVYEFRWQPNNRKRGEIQET